MKQMITMMSIKMLATIGATMGKITKQLISGIIKNINIIILSLSLFSARLVHASVGIPVFEDHIEWSNNVVVGKIKRLENGEFYFVIEESLKGNLIKNSMAILNHKSGMAWYVNAPGGPRKVSPQQFSERIVEKDWYSERIVLLGEFKDGLWINSNLDWSVWSSGKSTGKDKHEKLSLQELIGVIKAELKKDTEVK